MRMNSGSADFFYATTDLAILQSQYFWGGFERSFVTGNSERTAKKLICAFMPACVYKFKDRVTKAWKTLNDDGNILGPGSGFAKSHPCHLVDGVDPLQLLTDSCWFFFGELRGFHSSIRSLKSNRFSPIARPALSVICSYSFFYLSHRKII